MSATEPTPGVWVLTDDLGREYGRVELRRTTDGLRFRAEFRGDLIGWSTTLRTALEKVHMAFVRSHGPGGPPAADWGGR